MGQTLDKVCKWTSAKEGIRGKLEYNPTNENILNKILKFTEELPNKYRLEGELRFKQALQWETQLTLNDVTESETLEMKKKGDGFEVSVSTFESLARLLSAAAANGKISETRACLESNRDPITRILGDRFATIDSADSSTYRYIKEILEHKDEDDYAEKMAVLNLLLMMQDLDKQMMQEILSRVSEGTRITPDMVEHQMDVIKRYAGSDNDNHVVRSLDYTEGFEHAFRNGCRAHPRRQMHGDICYLTVTPHDGGALYVTAATSGFCVNKFTNDGVGTGELDYEKQGEYYTDLIALLRDNSSHFNKMIDKQVVTIFSYQ